MLELGFFIKKTVAFWLMPLSLVIIALGLSLYFLWRKPNAPYGKWLTGMAMAMLLMFSWNPISTPFLRSIEQTNEAFDITTNVDYVVVLGNLVISDPDVPLSSHLSSSATARLLEGLRILQANPKATLIVTGYAPDNIKSSAQVYKEVAISLGVKEDRIMTLDQPKDTEEEAKAVKHIVNDRLVALATSASHMPRALQFFKNENINAIAAPTFYLAKYSKETNWRFDSAGLLKTERAIYEYIGQFWQWLKH